MLTIQTPRPSLRTVYEANSEYFLNVLMLSFLQYFINYYFLSLVVVRVWMSVHVDASGQP